ncbi:MAG: polyprenyl synthetase family protein [Bacteroidetes bacterium]|nr:polyprenyl synthetase family protein [Bacteroidota bacterium]MBT4398193.1 polyprenyl synthetase family protein [Bacteroidota bacterium]MBT4409448.1 polyprenyl synthetase family protein [Bacteroidota bacterium]MBT7092616.1 polyprenyl synthetase family protein [Bacteroidota bacterium]MBT7462578.1 polyprenyl synthetase family protein [Bacteroidota bacterium]
MLTLSQLHELIEKEIVDQKKTLEPRELYEPIWYTLENGGKRLRPILVLMGCQLFNENIELALKPALGIEMFHNFTLLHDDIMDKAFLRRNQPTVHIKWDVNRAILSGDALAIQSNVYISSTTKEVLPKVLSVFNKTALEVCEGQQYDLNFEMVDEVGEDEYLKMISLKTAVLLAGSLKIGALIGGASDQDAEKLYSFGYDMGMAFQLQDDYLDSFGDPKVFGKKIGGDILANKKTLLLIKAKQLADEGELKKLNKWFSSKKGNPAKKIKEVIGIFIKLEIDKYIRGLVHSYSKLALASLGELDIEDNLKEELTQFTNSLINRVS